MHLNKFNSFIFKNMETFKEIVIGFTVNFFAAIFVFYILIFIVFLIIKFFGS